MKADSVTAAGAAPPGEAVVVSTAHGRLRGRRSGTGAVFLGIPYAAAPVAALRWCAPRPPQAWDGVRDALAFGPDAPQGLPATLRGPRQDEDCLYLNVWTPEADPAARLPVLAWIPGGGFLAGSGSDPGCDGAALAAGGAVVVTVNYRTGLFGFLAHPAFSAESPQGVSGNYGLLDQLAALAWVRENIAAFGGDPERVTPFGVSAGSASISLMLASPRARGLFQRAILQSPGAARPLASLPQAEEAGLRLGADLVALRALPWPELQAKTSLLTPAVRGLTTPRVLRPIRDGWLLPEDERPAFRGGRIRPMPLVVGTNFDEGTALTRTWPIGTLAAWREQLAGNFGAFAQEAAALYPARSDAQARAAVAAMFADTQFNYGARLLARSMVQAGAPAFKYLFLRRRPGQPDGPHHGGETAHMFGNLASGGAYDEADEALSHVIRGAWVRFAATGDPNGGALPSWQPYRAEADNHLALDAAIAPGGPWRQPQLDFLDRFFDAR